MAKTVVKKARYAAPGYSPEQMRAVGQGLIRRAIVPRIQSALDVRDNPAPPLKQTQRTNSRKDLFWIGAANRKKYPQYKQLRGGKPIRDWTLTGRTLRSLQVLSSSRNRCVIGFTDSVSNFRAFVNNRRWRQFGVSPKDKQVLIELFHQAGAANPPIKAVAA